MSKVKLAVIYYSMGGTNYQLAQWAKKSAEDLGAEVKLLQVPEIASAERIDANPAWKANMEATKHIDIATSEHIEWADAIIFSVPTRFGMMAAQMKQFFDTQGGLWAKGGTVNKVVSAMSSAQNQNGGQEATLLSLYTVMMHWGAIIATPGYTDPVIFASGGNPYGTSVTVDQEGKMIEDVEASVKHQAKRTIEVAQAVKNGLN